MTGDRDFQNIIAAIVLLLLAAAMPRAWRNLVCGTLLLAALVFDFIPGLWLAADPAFSNGEIASLDRSSALAFTICALYVSVRMALDGLFALWSDWTKPEEPPTHRVDYF